VYDHNEINSVCFSIIEEYHYIEEKNTTTSMITNPKVHGCVLAMCMPISLYHDNTRIVELVNGLISIFNTHYSDISLPLPSIQITIGCMLLIPYECVSTNNTPMCSKLWLTVMDVCSTGTGTGSDDQMWRIEYAIMCDVSILYTLYSSSVDNVWCGVYVCEDWPFYILYI